MTQFQNAEIKSVSSRKKIFLKINQNDITFLIHLIESVDAGTGKRIVSHDSFVGNQFIFSWLKL